MYNKKEGIDRGFDSSLMLIEESDSISSLIAEDDDKDRVLDEADFINYFERDYRWLNLLENLRLMRRINEPEKNIRKDSESGYTSDYLKEPAEVPYILKIFQKKEEGSDKEKQSDFPNQTKIQDLKFLIQEKKAA